MGLAGLAAGELLQGCAWSEPERPEPFNLLYFYDDQRGMEAIFSLLHEREPNLEVVPSAAVHCEVGPCPVEPPPDASQESVGQKFQQGIAGGEFEPLDAIASEQGWTSVIPPAVLDPYRSQDDGRLYGVPLSLDRSNTLFFNKALFEGNGLTPPRTIDEFFAVAEAFKAKGVTALSVCAQGWTLGVHVFDGVLIAEAGPQFYLDYWTGKKPIDAPEMQQALADSARMMDYANSDRVTTSWDVAATRVCRGEAAMTIMPTFARRAFESAGCADQVDVVPMQRLGTPSFVFASGGFTLRHAAPHPTPGATFLRVVGSAEGQQGFNGGAPSTPARLDVVPTELAPLSQKAYADFTSADETLVPSYLFLAEASAYAVNSSLADFVDPSSANYKNVAPVLQALRQSPP